MPFLRRDRRGVNRYLYWQVGIVFLAAGVWLGGVIIEASLVTGAAVVLLVIAMVLGFLGRRRTE